MRSRIWVPRPRGERLGLGLSDSERGPILEVMNTLVYDAENRMVNYLTAAYTYDGNGLRVEKVSGSTTTVYIFSGSKVIAEYDNGAVPTSPSREYVYGGATLLAKIAGSTTTYYHQDHLSNRLVTSSTGATGAQMGHFPFGESWYNASNDKLLFTSYERDAESGNDYAMARYNMSRLGRFSSPDPVAGSPADPQSLNRYAYALNDPLDFEDPSGLEIIAIGDCRFDHIVSFIDTGSGPEYAGEDFVFLGCSVGGTTIVDPEVGGGPKSSGNSSGPTMRAGKPVPPCRIVGPFLAALEFTVKAGPEIQAGPVKLGGSLYKNITTGDTGGKMEGSVGLVGAQIDNPTPPGGNLGGTTEGTQTSVSFFGFQYNFTTHDLQFAPSKSFSLGLQLGVGGEVSFNSATFKQQSAANAACQAQGGN